MSNQRAVFYSRLKPEDESPRAVSTYESLAPNLDLKKLQRRCFLALFLAFVIAFSLWLFDPPTQDKLKPDRINTDAALRCVVIVHRHASRSALHQYTFEPNVSWGVDPGSLLNNGFKEAFKFGRRLREEYLEPEMSGIERYISYHSTNIHRTVDTANSILYGLLTEKDREPTDGDCSCRPEGGTRSTTECIAKCIGIPQKELPSFKPWDDDKNEILRQFDVCPEFENNKDNYEHSDTYKNESKSLFADQFKYVREELIASDKLCSVEKEKKCHSLMLADLDHIRDTADCLAALNASMTEPYANPKNVSDRLKTVSEWHWHHMFPTKIGPWIGGILLGRILQDLDAATKRPTRETRPLRLAAPYKGNLMVLYSAHDSTIAALLAAMNQENWEFPHFLSYIAFELYVPKPSITTNLADHYVRVVYQESSNEIAVGDCPQEFCPWSTFKESLQDRIQTPGSCSKNDS